MMTDNAMLDGTPNTSMDDAAAAGLPKTDDEEMDDELAVTETADETTSTAAAETESMECDDEEDWDDDESYGCEFGAEITCLNEESLEVLRNDKAIRVDLCDCASGEKGIVELCDALMCNSSVEELVLDNVGMGENEVRALANLIETTRTISDVRLRRDDIGNEGICILADALACNESIAALDLCENGFTTRGARALVKALERNITLAFITVVGNDIGDAGAEAFARASCQLEQRSVPPSLKGLSLMDCNVGDRGALAFAMSLQQKSSLTSLYLAGNSIGDRGAAALAGTLRADCNLKAFSLESNPFSRQGLEELAWALLLNTTLTHVVIRPTLIDGDGDGDGDAWANVRVVTHYICKDVFSDSEVDSFVASLFNAALGRAPSVYDLSIAERNLEEGGFSDRPMRIDGIDLDLNDSSTLTRAGQRRLLRSLCRAGLKRLGQYPALISE